MSLQLLEVLPLLKPILNFFSLSMKTINYFAIIQMVFAIFSCSTASQKQKTGLHIDPIDSLLALMTLEEKIGQTVMYSGNAEITGPSPQGGNRKKAETIKKGLVGGMLNVVSSEATLKAQKLAVEHSRLGIPLIFGYDIIHGYKTMFQVPLGQAASWDANIARKAAQIAAREGSAAGIHWTFAPMVDISRDARWGRIMEGPGEDPYLGSVMAQAWVKGYQGEDLSSIETLAACAKHFAAYGFVEAGREYNTVDISLPQLLNVVLPPFKAASHAGAATFMNAFNDINGVPATGNQFLQRTILKNEWGFQGFVVSDWASITEMIAHGYASDTIHAAELAMNAGSDMDMEGRAYEKGLKQKIEEGAINEELLNDAVRRILWVKHQLGLFDDPYRYVNAEREQQELLSRENLQASREIARETFVLLKNEDEILPINKTPKSIAVIGQLAASKDDPLGNWRAQAVQNSAVSVLEGIQNVAPSDMKVSFAKGYTLSSGLGAFPLALDFVESDRSGFPEAIKIAKSSDVVIMVMGESCFQSGEGRSQVNIELKGEQNELLEEIFKVNKNVVVVLMTGRPVPLVQASKHSKAILETWYAGSEAGNAIAEVLFGDHAPSGKLPVSFPYHSGQEPLYYNRKSTGRPVNSNNDILWSRYTDSPNEALFPFGHGLSYTTFKYSDLEVKTNDGSLSVYFNVSNTGARDGKEVVQLYIRDLVASVTRPVKELKRFKKIEIMSGQSVQVNFNLEKEDLSFYNNLGEKVFEPGGFKIYVGGSSVDCLEAEASL